VSIPTIDDAVRAHFEPRGAPIAERLALLATLRAAAHIPSPWCSRSCPLDQGPSADALAATVTR